MTRTHLLVVLALAGTSPLAAQQAITATAKKSAGQAQAQRAVMMYRDSILGAQAALAQLERDYTKASAGALEARAGVVATRCAGALRTLPVARQLLVSADLTTPEHERGRSDMLASMEATKKPLGNCEQTFKPLAERGKGEEVRGYGNQRAKPIKKELGKFDPAVLIFAKALGLDTHETLGKAGQNPDQLPAARRPPSP